MLRDYRGKTVYVVGGSQGIGRACAEAFAERGADVVVFARREGPLRDAIEVIAGRRADAAQGVFGVVLDASDGEKVEPVMAKALTDYGPPDVLLNCAGAASPARFEDIDSDSMLQTLRSNWLSCWYPAKALVPVMKERGGVIVNTSSVAGCIGVFGYTDYSAAKFAVVGFSEALRSELAPHGVAVFVLCPPDTDTPGYAAEEVAKPEETRAVSGGASLLSSAEVASELLRGLSGRGFLIVPGRAARWVVRAQRFAPGLVRWFTDRAVAKAQRSSPR